MIEPVDFAEVYIWDVRVGVVAYDRKSGLASFEYDSNWIGYDIELFPIHMPLSRETYSFPALPRETYKGLPAGLADTLPDDFGNAIIDTWLSRQGRDKASFSPVERLLYTGNRGMGALEYRDAINLNNGGPQELQLDSLVKVAQEILDSRGELTVDLAGDEEQAIKDLFQVGVSAGGARPKAVIAINEDRTSVLSGQADAPEGYEHYLIKFDGVTEKNQDKETYGDPQGFGRSEYAYFLMARDAGITISDCELLKTGDLAHFMTKRFDRVNGGKLHYQSYCAMGHVDFRQKGAHSYEGLLGTMRELGLTRDEQIELFRRSVFNIVARNQDDHTKNFGFLQGGDGVWALAPAFDVAYSYNPKGDWTKYHQMSVNGKVGDFTRADLLSVCDKITNFKEKEANDIINRVVEIVSQWDSYAERAGVFDWYKKQIASNLRLGI
ncbi:type II toxin-antitoxin system HipA family toxin [Dasania marina]|uniref:type II toxin-antitoxin system HipA family toxin n=1 Tax=Dasania marina TaxID=471499 RepID=UPI0030DB2950|tara:strand:- start:7619 stop:8932 length:1314 start_codon:yes stop_codon:yes gene_type:complete